MTSNMTFIAMALIKITIVADRTIVISMIRLRSSVQVKDLVFLV